MRVFVTRLLILWESYLLQFAAVKFIECLRLLAPRVYARVCPMTSVTSDSVTPWTAAHQAPLSTGFSRQGSWGGLPGPPPGDWTWVSGLAGRLFTPWAAREAPTAQHMQSTLLLLTRPALACHPGRGFLHVVFSPSVASAEYTHTRHTHSTHTPHMARTHMWHTHPTHITHTTTHHTPLHMTHRPHMWHTHTTHDTHIPQTTHTTHTLYTWHPQSTHDPHAPHMTHTPHTWHTPHTPHAHHTCTPHTTHTPHAYTNTAAHTRALSEYWQL